MINIKSNNNKFNRVLIIHTDGNTFNNPSLKCIIDLLLENGFRIDLRYPKTFSPMPTRKNIKLLPYGKIIRRLKSIIFDRLCSQFLANLSVFTEYILLYKNYDLIIGVDRQGLIEANILNKLSKTPYIFISFEIMFESETSARYKLLEKKASKNVSFWIIQDELRAQKLKIENELRDMNKITLPLSSAGIGYTNKSRLRDLLDVPKHKKVAIAIGSLADWSMANDILQSVTNWPDDWVLIVNERYGRAREILIEELLELKPLLGKKIFISNSATEMIDDMSTILSGVDVGLAFYRPDYNHIYTGDNIKYLGLASGKISTYLRYGVPVIVNEIGLYAEEIRKHKLGCVADGPDKISDKLDEVKNNNYAESARDYFIHNLDFKLYENNILSNILSIINTENQNKQGTSI